MNTTKATLKLLWSHAWRYPQYVIALLIIAPVVLLLQQYIAPLIVANVLDRLSTQDFVSGDLLGSFGPELIAYAVIILGSSIIGWRLIVMLIWRLEMKVIRDIAQRVFSHLLDMSSNFHANHFGGSLTTQANKLGSAYVRLADTTIFQIISLTVGLAATIVILAPRAPQFVIALVLFSVFYMIIAFAVTKSIRKLNAAEASAHSKQTGYLADSISNVMAVKSFAAEDQERRQFAQATEETRTATSNLMRATLKRDLAFGSVHGLITVSALVIAAATVVIFQNTDIGTVFLIMSYTATITHQLWQFSTSTLRNINRSLGDARDMVKILNEEPEVKDPASPATPAISKGQISFNNMSFTHGDAKEDDALFTNFNLTINAGEKIGLVGHSGSGKTTLTRLLLRFSDLDDGVITIDGQDIATLRQTDLRRHIAYVPQEPILFHRSLRDNIAYGKPHASDEEVIAAAKKARAHEFIQKLPDGYETLVGERGVKLSGGQRQRIAIARAFIKDAPILVLDEATSALDSESEVLIQKALWELMEGRTAIAIAHRLSTIQKMDRIVVLENGAIAEQGTHKTLIGNQGIYADLWSHQSGGFIEE